MSARVDMVSEEVRNYSDQELRVQLTGLGMDVGPITGTTRTLYERKLVQLLTGTRSEFSEESPQTPPKSPRKSPRQSPPAKKSPPHVTTNYDAADSYIQSGSLTFSCPPSEDSTINLIRPRKPVPRAPVEEPVRRKFKSPQSSPFPAANAQFKKAESDASLMDHVLKYALFGVVMIIIVYFISNQDAGNALEQKH